MTGGEIAAERAKEIVDHLPVAVYRTTPDGKILEGNQAVQALLGYTPGEFTSLGASDLYFENQDRGPFGQKRLDDADVVRTVLRLKHKDGHAVWAEDMGRAVKDSEGNVLYFDGTLVDISQQVEAERELREREQTLATIHDKAPIAIFNLGPDGKVFQANPTAHTMLGLEPGELIGKTISEFTFSDDAKESQEAFARIKSGETDEVALDKRYRRVDGKAIWGHVRAVAIRAPDGSFSHTISLVQDITRRKRTEDAFRLLDELTRQVNAAEDLEEALKAMLDNICESIGFSYGEAWLPDSEGVLHLSPAWHGPDSREMQKFRHLSGKLEFRSGEGLPGISMASDETVWFENLQHNAANVRASAAAGVQLTCGLGVPVRTGGQVVAVLVFMDAARETPREHTMRLVKFLANRLGSTVARRRLEIKLNEQAALMEAQLEGSREGILVTSKSGEILMVNRPLLLQCGVECGEAEQNCKSMELFERERKRPEFMELIQRLVEDRSDGAGNVSIEDVDYERRSVSLPDGDGRVWYFTKAA